MKVKCQVIEDLLPLYIDGVCSEESRMLVEEHLRECSLCSAKLKAQKSEIIIDDNVIKENLKLKEPFKKIKRSVMLRITAVIAAIPLLFLLVVEIGGNGVGFSALIGRYKAERVLSYIERGQFKSAAGYMAFTGGRYKEIKNEEEAKAEWIAGMEELKRDGIEFLSHGKNKITTDDRFTSGYVKITVKYNNELYDFMLFISTNNGKVEPGYLYLDYTGKRQEATEVEKMLIEIISNVISTINPG